MADIAPKWRGMDDQTRADAYSPSKALPDGDLMPFIRQYIFRSAAAYATCGPVQTLHYGPKPANTLDLVVPKSDTPVPLHLFIHGGYWQELSKTESFLPAPDLLSQSIAFAALDYTLAPEATMDEIVAEVCAALTLIRTQAADLGLDPSRFLVSGSSAGAHLAAMATLKLPQTARPNALALLSGVYDLRPLLNTYINDAVGMDADSATRNSPALQSLTGFPKTLIAWGKQEPDEFHRQSKHFAHLLDAAGTPVNTLECETRNHFDIIFDLANASPLGTKITQLTKEYPMPRYKPVFPNLIDPAQVNTSIEPRPMGKTTDETRAATARQTGGAPLVDYEGNANPYIDYQSIDLLLSLQHPRSDGYDEMAFFVMGQVKELLFRGLHFELYNARAQIKQDNIADALTILHRAGQFVDYIGKSWDVLSTITPEGFNAFRDHLSTASGQLSFMYRHVEFILGNKSRRLATAHKNVPHVWPAIKEALATPSLYDEVIFALHRAGHGIDDAALQRDWSEPTSANSSVHAAWLAIYAEPTAENTLYQLAEALVALDEKFSLYRWRHFTSVHKIIGYKPGTGGSAGVGWLQHVTEHRFFPELWDIRTDL